MTDAPLRGAVALLLGLGVALSAGGEAAATSLLGGDDRTLAAPWRGAEEPWKRTLDDYRATLRERERAQQLDTMQRRLDTLEREAAEARFRRDWERAFGPPYD